jgi:hypothetical protein
VRKKARRTRFCLAAALAVSAAVTTTCAQSAGMQISEVTNTENPPATAENSRPVYQLDRSEEDWSGLCRQINGRGDFWDPLKCIGLGRPHWYVSLGAELRGSYEVYRNYNWGSGPQDGNGYYLNRLISHGDFHLGPSVRLLRNSRVVLSSVAMGAPGPRSMRTNLTSASCFSS